MKYKIFMSFFISFTIILSGCSVIGTGKKGKATNTYKPNFDDFNPGRLEYKKLHVIVPALNAVPQNFQAHTDTVKEMNEILLSVINTEIEFEHVIYHNQIQEIYERLFSGISTDIIDFIPKTEELPQILQDFPVVDLTDKLIRYYPEIYEENVDFADIFINDRIYVMPKIVTNAYNDRICLIINREFYESAGSPKVNSVEDIVRLYEYGLENTDSRGRMFLDPSRKLYFVLEFHTFLQLFCQENGYIPAALMLVIKDGKIMPLEDTNVLSDWFYTVNDLFKKNAVVHAQAGIMSQIQSDIGMGLTSYNSLKNSLYWPEHFNQKYKVLFVGDYEPYPQKNLVPMAMIMDNENTERSIMMLRLLYEDEQLNRMIQYGLENTHYKRNDGRIEMISNTQYRYTKNWWPSLINERYRIPMDHEPEGVEQYVEDLHRYPKNILPGVSNFFMSGAVEKLSNDPIINEALQQRGDLINKLLLMNTALFEEMPYDLLIQETLDGEKQKMLLEALMEYIEDIKK